MQRLLAQYTWIPPVWQAEPAARIRTALDPGDALRLLDMTDDWPALVLLDASGTARARCLDFLQWLHQASRPLPAIVFSDGPSPSVVRRAYALGAGGVRHAAARRVGPAAPAMALDRAQPDPADARPPSQGALPAPMNYARGCARS